jgi:hypothetical protein
MLGLAPRKEGDVTRAAHAADVGDLIVIAGHYVGESERIAEILEVVGEPPDERYRVRWDDGHESVYFPGSDARIKHSVRPSGTRKAKR